MQGGFAMLEVGCVLSKNATNILIKNLLDAFIAGFAYWLVGYAIAIGEGNSFVGHTYFAHHGLEPGSYSLWFFHYVFAATAATIVSGAVAERCDFIAYLIYSSAITAFVGAKILGPRIGWYDEVTGEPREIQGRSIVLAALGGFILLFGFLAFNAAAAGSISGEGQGNLLSKLVVNTAMSGSVGGIIAMIIQYIKGGHKWNFNITLNVSLCAMSLAWQCVGILSIVAWPGGTCVILFGTMRAFNILRIPLEYELKGIDIPKHGQSAYPTTAYGHSWGEGRDEKIPEEKGEKGGYLNKRITEYLRSRNTS
ncbi:putative ammonium transporter 1 [Argopecten irradians]|uniref:putative ammonium transporter 1 n=1 Tax=Argopecten irradians TaxID=31199 RepID=UPI00371F47FE